MLLEHVAFNVKDPAKVATWYASALGMSVLRAGGPPLYPHFVVDATGSTVLEFLNKADVPVPDYASIDPFNLHIAFHPDDIQAAYARLLEAGATKVDALTTNASGDQLVFLRDPWGLTIQLVQRAKPLR